MKDFMVVGVSREFMGGGNYVIEAKLRSTSGEELYAVINSEAMTVNKCSLTDDRLIKDPDYLSNIDSPGVLYCVHIADSAYTVTYEDEQGFEHDVEQHSCAAEYWALYNMMLAIWLFYADQGLV